MRKRQKTIISACGALCLCGMALNGATNISVKAQELNAAFVEETLLPVWEGDTAYYESVLPVENEYGGVDPINLLYPIEEIISVQNAEMTKTYQEGVDYTVSKGRLIIADDGSIPLVSYTEFYPLTGTAGFESNEGGYICFQEGTWFHSKQIVITYKHKVGYDGYIPEGKAQLLPNVTQKLSNKKNLDVLVFGDSISVGANSSGFTGISPYLPTYPQLFKTKLESAYGVKINLTNPSVGGMGIDWGIEQIDSVLSQQTGLDLAVVAFGMNDGNLLPEVFAQKANQLIAAIQAKFPDAEILLVASMLPNPKAVHFYRQQVDFAPALLEKCEKEGVAVVNMTAVHKGLLERKNYADMTGNNVNHPNDYMARVYAQTLFATLQEKKVESDCQIDQSDVSSEGPKPAGSFFGLLFGGCMSTAAAPTCAAATLGAAVLLKKKKDE